MYALVFVSSVYPAGNMWVDVRAAAMSGALITGILNPNSGPIVDNGTTMAYQAFLSDEMGIGDGATASDFLKPTVLSYRGGGREAGGVDVPH